VGKGTEYVHPTERVEGRVRYRTIEGDDSAILYYQISVIRVDCRNDRVICIETSLGGVHDCFLRVQILHSSHRKITINHRRTL
jgi:hypothetical protein